MVVGEELLNFFKVFANIFLRHFYTPQDLFPYSRGLSALNIFTLQIKNIKLHIVTDIKVTFNSMLGFRISLFGWGEGNSNITKKLAQLHATMFATLHGANNYLGTKPCACLVLDFSNKT